MSRVERILGLDGSDRARRLAEEQQRQEAMRTAAQLQASLDAANLALRLDPAAQLARKDDGSLDITSARRDQIAARLQADPNVQSVVVTGSGVHVTFRPDENGKLDSAQAILLARLLGVSPQELMHLSPSQLQAKVAQLQSEARQQEQRSKTTDEPEDGYRQPRAPVVALPTSDLASASPGSPPPVEGVESTPLATLNLAEGHGTASA